MNHRTRTIYFATATMFFVFLNEVLCKITIPNIIFITTFCACLLGLITILHLFSWLFSNRKMVEITDEQMMEAARKLQENSEDLRGESGMGLLYFFWEETERKNFPKLYGPEERVKFIQICEQIEKLQEDLGRFLPDD